MKSSKGMAKTTLQFTEVLACTVCQVVLQLGPDKPIGVDLGPARWITMRHQPRVAPQEHKHVSALVNRPAIPKQLDWSSEMTKEHDDFRPRDVVGMEMHIQTEPRSGRRDQHGGDSQSLSRF